METNNQNISSSHQPIYIIGAGGIVADAHLPAYALAGFRVEGIFDTQKEKANKLAKDFDIPVVFDSMEQFISSLPENAIIDLAIPAEGMAEVLNLLPDGSGVLMQKPMGADLVAATDILTIVEKKKLTAAVNFQLRYAPFIIEAKKLIAAGIIGQICDIEINVNVQTPWHLWTFLYDAPRTEILYHSIHYIDLIRHLLGNPFSTYARTVKHPRMTQLASVKSSIILDYGDYIRANILTNHCHDFGTEKQHSYIRIEGTGGAILITMGLLMNYPTGVPDRFEYIDMSQENACWKKVELNGSWFPHAFIGSMQDLMNAVSEKSTPGNSAADAIDTMAVVEAAYLSDIAGGQQIPYFKFKK